MKRIILTMGLVLAFMAANAQSADDYIVKTKGVKKTTTTTPAVNVAEPEKKGNEPTDFVGKNFKYHSLCDWTPGMKFMVMPEKYDLIVKTFCDAGTGKEVSSMSLRHQIMVYQGHNVSSEGHARINFQCLGDGKMYYYEVPNGTFEDYCYSKTGVPTLAYLDDVDIARKTLVGKKLITKSTIYYVDTDYDSDGAQQVKVPINHEVTVRRVGVGTRNFPVKIIVEDEKGNEFFQNVALSKTNSGMRDDEFTNDYTRNAFYGSFSLFDDMMAVSGDINDYIGKIVHTKFVTGMITKGDGRERTVRVPKMTTFTIDLITQQNGGDYVTLSLTEMESRRQYFKDVIFNATGPIDETSSKKDEYFGYIFAMGEGVAKQTSQAARAAIRAGRVIAGMTEDEVQLAVGEPDRINNDGSGRYEWVYLRSKGKLLIVQFGRNRIVTAYKTAMDSQQKQATKKTTTKKNSSNNSWQNRPGTPLTNE